jgi:hypothetical protein
MNSCREPDAALREATRIVRAASRRAETAQSRAGGLGVLLLLSMMAFVVLLVHLLFELST